MDIYFKIGAMCIFFIGSFSCIITANVTERTTANTPSNTILDKKDALAFLTQRRVKRGSSSLWEECTELYGCSVGDVYSDYGYSRPGLAYEYMSGVLCAYVTCPWGYRCTYASSGTIYHIRDLKVRCLKWYYHTSLYNTR